MRSELGRILTSIDSDASQRSREFLRFIVEETLAGRADSLTQSAIATAVFGRKDDFDPVVDPIVRIQAGRLRRSLERYYLLSGKQNPLRIELPKGGYVPVFRAVEGTTPEALPARAATARESGDGWPSIVVSHFDTATRAADAEEAAALLNEELTMELGRYQAVRVVLANQLDAVGAQQRLRLALRGNVHPGKDGWRVTAQLVDPTTGAQIWGEQYVAAPRAGSWRGSVEDVARVIAARVAAEEGVVVQRLATERRRQPPGEPSTYDAILQSYEFFLARDLKSFAPTLRALRQALESQPDCGLAWTRLARLCVANYSFEVTEIQTPIDEALGHAQRGVRLDPTSRSARCILAACLLVKGELSAGRTELRQALSASPGSLVYLEIIGYLLTLLGDWELGATLSKSARERNPHCLPQVLFGMWADALRRGAVEEAYQAALEFPDPTFFWRSVMRASCLGLLGRTAEAKSEVAEILVQKAAFPERGRVLIGYYVKFPEVMGRIEEGLAKAGLRLA